MRSATNAPIEYASGSSGLSLAPWPRWSTPITRYPAFVSMRTQPVSTQLSRQLDAKPCTHSTVSASGSPHVYVATWYPSADMT